MDEQLYRFEFQALGGPNELQVYAIDSAQAQQAQEIVIQEVARIEQKYSRYRPDSILSQINNAAGSSEAIVLDEETAGLLRFADRCFHESDGLFDISSGVLRRVWDFKNPALPAPEKLSEVLSLIGWQKVHFDGKSISLSVEGMQIDLGGIGKEYAADRAALLLSQSGFENALINLGGDVVVTGPQADGSSWRIGIVHPRQEGQVLGRFDISSGAIATSGDYQRYFELGGQRYCHIMNPRSGYPVQDLQAVSVVGESCLIAGIMSSFAMLYGEKRARKVLEENRIAHIRIRKDGSLAGYPAALLQQVAQN